MNKTKICSKCKQLKPLKDFVKNKNEKDGFHYRCKECDKKWREKNKHWRKKYMKIWRTKNKKHLKNYNKKYKSEHKEEVKIQQKQYNVKNKKRIAKIVKTYKDSHKKELAKKAKIYNKKNKYKRQSYIRNRLKTDLNFKLRNYLRSRVRLALKGNPKLSTTMNLIGCSIEKFKQHIEAQFKSGMSWDNYGIGGWELDHIKPCIKFKLTKLEEQKICFHYTNLQPLWAKENRQKNSRRKNGKK